MLQKKNYTEGKNDMLTTEMNKDFYELLRKAIHDVQESKDYSVISKKRIDRLAYLLSSAYSTEIRDDKEYYCIDWYARTLSDLSTVLLMCINNMDDEIAEYRRTVHDQKAEIKNLQYEIERLMNEQQRQD